MDKHEKEIRIETQIPLVLTKIKESYHTWHDYLENISKINRQTIGNMIDGIFLSLLELIFRAIFAHDKFEKLSLVSQALGKNDLLKFFLQIAWENKVIERNIYGKIIIDLDNVGRMLGGWKKNLKEKTPTR